MPPEITAAEFYAQALSAFARIDNLLTVILYAVCCSAATGTFLILMYAARNKNFWGCIALAVSLSSVSSASAASVTFPSGVVFTPTAASDGALQGFTGTASDGAEYFVGINVAYNVFFVDRNGVTVYTMATAQVAMRDTAYAYLENTHECTCWIIARAYVSNPAGGDTYIETYCDCAEACDPGGCPECDPYDEESIGLNCCSGTQFGATYYVATDGEGCEYLACNSASCHECEETPGLPVEGSSCSCEDGYIGSYSYNYDENGCAVSAFCDSCEPCPDLPGVDGEACTMEGGDPGIWYPGEPAPDGCPTLDCIEEPGPCEIDSNRDGVPDYLEGNPYKDYEEGAECFCADDSEGTIIMVENEDGCLVPTCSCDVACDGKDQDGDECCDDEDPDPEDPEVNCQDCEYNLAEKVSAIVALLRDKIDLESGGTGNKDWLLDVDLNSASAFGIRFGGNLTTGEFWQGNEGGAPRAEVEEVFSFFLGLRSTVRTILSLCVYFMFTGSVLHALFDPSR